MKLKFDQEYCGLLLLAICFFSPTSASAGEWVDRLYGYRPRVYGTVPSEYVFPRYGFHRAYVYFEGPPYGSPALGDPNHIPPCPPPPSPEEFLAPGDATQIMPVIVSQSSGPSSRRVR
jgi:hypothetical protein